MQFIWKLILTANMKRRSAGQTGVSAQIAWKLAEPAMFLNNFELLILCFYFHRKSSTWPRHCYCSREIQGNFYQSSISCKAIIYFSVLAKFVVNWHFSFIYNNWKKKRRRNRGICYFYNIMLSKTYTWRILIAYQG